MPLDQSIVGKPSEPAHYAYTWREAVLYALGIGAKRDELDYLFEGRGPKVYPSFAVVPKFAPMLAALGKTGGNLAMVVHGGEKVILHKPFPAAANLTSTATVRGIYDMRKFAQVLIDTESKDDKSELVATTTSSILFRGEGGWGGEPAAKEDSGIAVPKDRPGDFRLEEKTTEEQALLYRLSGDLNPLHADPDFAKSVGFDKGPILHGLCTFGYMVRHLVKGACSGDGGRVAAFEGQFKRPVWPGDTIATEGWHVGDERYALQVKVKERDEVVIGAAWAKLRA